MKKKHKLISIFIVTLFVLFAFAGCGDAEQCASGFYVGWDTMGFSFRREVFDLDNVTFTVYYGWGEVEENHERFLTRNSMPEFGLYVQHSPRSVEERYYTSEELAEEWIAVSLHDEQYYSEAYSIKYVNRYSDSPEDLDGMYVMHEIAFTHSEEITIPKEMFNKDYHALTLMVYGENVNAKEPNSTPFGIRAVGLFYKLLGNNQVELLHYANSAGFPYYSGIYPDYGAGFFPIGD